jgi:hypothetical protein
MQVMTRVERRDLVSANAEFCQWSALKRAQSSLHPGQIPLQGNGSGRWADCPQTVLPGGGLEAGDQASVTVPLTVAA